MEGSACPDEIFAPPVMGDRSYTLALLQELFDEHFKKVHLREDAQLGRCAWLIGWWVVLEKWNDNEQREYRLSLSCGVAEYKPGRTIEDVIKAADADLYVEKASRGQVEALP